MGVTLYELGILRRMQGRQAEAAALLKESLELALEKPSQETDVLGSSHRVYKG